MAALQSMNGNGLPEWHNPHARAVANDEPFVEIRYRSTLCAQLVTSLLHVLSLSSAEDFTATMLDGAAHGGDYLAFAEGVLEGILGREEAPPAGAPAPQQQRGGGVESSTDPFGLESVRSKQFDEDSPVHGRKQTGEGDVGVGSLLRVSGASFPPGDLEHARALLVSARLARASL